MIYFDTLLSDVIINNTNFTGNQAINGGVFYIYFSGNITLSSCNFYQNYATGNGGVFSYYQGLYFKYISILIYFQLDSSNLKFSVNNCKFQENTALSEGGVIKIFNQIPNFAFNKYSDNTAHYGNMFASYPIRMNYSSKNKIKK